MIRFPKSHVRAVIAKAYELSRPQGMGFYHFTPGPLPEDQIDQIAGDSSQSVNLDYVNGRAVKLYLKYDRVTQDFQFDRDNWYDHFPAEFEALCACMKGKDLDSETRTFRITRGTETVEKSFQSMPGFAWAREVAEDWAYNWADKGNVTIVEVVP